MDLMVIAIFSNLSDSVVHRSLLWEWEKHSFLAEVDSTEERVGEMK